MELPAETAHRCPLHSHLYLTTSTWYSNAGCRNNVRFFTPPPPSPKRDSLHPLQTRLWVEKITNGTVTLSENVFLNCIHSNDVARLHLSENETRLLQRRNSFRSVMSEFSSRRSSTSRFTFSSSFCRRNRPPSTPSTVGCLIALGSSRLLVFQPLDYFFWDARTSLSSLVLTRSIRGRFRIFDVAE